MAHVAPNCCFSWCHAGCCGQTSLLRLLRRATNSTQAYSTTDPTEESVVQTLKRISYRRPIFDELSLRNADPGAEFFVLLKRFQDCLNPYLADIISQAMPNVRPILDPSPTF